MPLTTRRQIRNAAMKLPPNDREALAEEILLSVSGEDRDAIDRAWLADVRRRDSAFRNGKSRAKPVDQVLARLEAKARR